VRGGACGACRGTNDAYGGKGTGGVNDPEAGAIHGETCGGAHAHYGEGNSDRRVGARVGRAYKGTSGNNGACDALTGGDDGSDSDDGRGQVGRSEFGGEGSDDDGAKVSGWRGGHDEGRSQGGSELKQVKLENPDQIESGGLKLKPWKASGPDWAWSSGPGAASAGGGPDPKLWVRLRMKMVGKIPRFPGPVFHIFRSFLYYLGNTVNGTKMR
jgi:hypothetical protein